MDPADDSPSAPVCKGQETAAGAVWGKTGGGKEDRKRVILARQGTDRIYMTNQGYAKKGDCERGAEKYVKRANQGRGGKFELEKSKDAVRGWHDRSYRGQGRTVN